MDSDKTREGGVVGSDQGTANNGGDAGGSTQGSDASGTGSDNGDENGGARNGDETAAAAPVVAEPKGITTDDKTRYLVEIVANKGLSKAAEQIASQIGAKKGILIVDDLELAASDLHYLDIKNKLAAFKKLVEDEKKKCDDLRQEIEAQEKTVGSLADEVDGLKVVFEGWGPAQKPLYLIQTAALPAITGLIGAATAVGTVATAISGSLAAVADVISYFRAEYEIKGQDLGTIDEIYIKALVGNHLVKQGAEVLLFDFRLVDKSDILKDLGDLLKSHLSLLSCLEYVDLQGMEPQIEALRSYVEELRTRYAEAIIEINDQVLLDLEVEIDASRNRIAQYQQNRFSDTQVAALEAHLGALQAKLVEAVATDTGASELALRNEIARATAELEKSETSQAKRDELTAHRNNMLAELAKVLVLKNSDTVDNLKGTVSAVEDALATIRKERVPQSRIAGEEQHLAALLAKQAELIAVNDNNAADALKVELAKMEDRLKEVQRLFLKSSRQVNGGKRISDALTAFVENVTTVPSNSPYSPLIAACLREYVANKALGVNYLLKLRLISAGGEVITSKDWGFWNRPDLSYLGGGIVSYVLADRSGKLLAADTVHGISKLEHRIGDSPRSLNYKIE